jgi:L-lactate dehydrogenase complex protein LldG
VSDAREEVLARIRAALASGPQPEPVSRRYRRGGSRSSDERVGLFCSRVREYRAEVHRVGAAEIAATVATVCLARGVNRLLIPAELPPPWRPRKVELVEDRELDPRELDAVGAVLTGCTLAIAETGTIALTSRPHEGRRALTLVPDVHLCVVEEEQILELVPEAITRLHTLVADERRPVTLVSGPSATADIEFSRVEGVHGPRTLIVLVASGL